jgi:hypothetical protein
LKGSNEKDDEESKVHLENVRFWFDFDLSRQAGIDPLQPFVHDCNRSKASAQSRVYETGVKIETADGR